MGCYKDNETEYMPDYLTEKNATLIEATISDIVDDYMYSRKKASYKKLNPSQDDNFSFSQSST